MRQPAIPVEADMIEVVRVRAGCTQRWQRPVRPDLRVSDLLATLPAEALENVAGYALHGTRVREQARVRAGDRLELLEALQVDPQQARRKRAETFVKRRQPQPPRS